MYSNDEQRRDERQRWRKAVWLAVLALGLAGGIGSGAWAQEPPSVKTGCNGQLSARFAKIAAPYQQVVAALKGTETGWCEMAAEVKAGTPEDRAVLWEFVSSGYVMHAAYHRKPLTAAQWAAVRKLLPLSYGTGMTRPKRLGDFTHELYVHMRGLSAANYLDPQWDVEGTMDALEKRSPAVYKTLMPGVWGDPGAD